VTLKLVSRLLDLTLSHFLAFTGDAAAWPVQGLLRHFKKDIEDRIDNPEGFDHEAAFQKAWSGDPFSNSDWTKKHGAGMTYAAKN
jgi:NADH dehydrogenase (ubiquinone) flavoprotein 1